MHNVCLNQDVSEYPPKTSLFPKKMHETTLKIVKKRSVKLAKMPWHQEEEEYFETDMEENMKNHHEEEAHNHAREGPVNHDGQERRVLGSYINPNPGNYGSSILKPTIHANNLFRFVSFSFYFILFLLNLDLFIPSTSTFYILHTAYCIFKKKTILCI